MSRSVLALRHQYRRPLHISSASLAPKDDGLGRLHELMDKFRDPTSHYHIPPGTNGPAAEDDHSTSRAPPALKLSTPAGDAESSWAKPETLEKVYDRSREGGLRWFKSNGYDLRGRLEWPVAWGDCDMFQHANNVQFVRWFESSRIKYTESFMDELPAEVLTSLLRGRGNGMILRDIAVRYRAPVTWPDTLMIANRPHSIDQTRASFSLSSAAWSLKANKLVATAESTMVMYDYDHLRKGFMSDQIRDVLTSRVPA